MLVFNVLTAEKHDLNGVLNTYMEHKLYLSPVMYRRNVKRSNNASIGYHGTIYKVYTERIFKMRSVSIHFRLLFGRS